MPFIQFPNVPAYPGVPELVRPVSIGIAETPILAIGIGTLRNILGSSLQQVPLWGIFDSDGNRIGISATQNNSFLDSLESQFTGFSGATSSTFSFDFVRESSIAGFPIEEGGFANYNKVQISANPVVVLAFTGSETERYTFLTALDGAVASTDLYSIATPEITYVNYAFERYSLRRRADGGATMLLAEISLKEIRQVSATFTQVSAIVAPVDPTATPSIDSGKVQPATPDVSTAKSIMNTLQKFTGGSN